MKDKILQTVNKHKILVDNFIADGIDVSVKIAALITESINNNGCVYICGNGGSAADAQHIAGELVGRFLRERRPLPAVAFGCDSSVMTSIANDYDFNSVFAKSVEALAKSGDILWAISTSGTSKNIIAAVEKAKDMNVKIVGFAGRKGSKLESLSDICLCVDGENSYQIQQIHQIAYHIICDLIEQAFC